MAKLLTLDALCDAWSSVLDADVGPSTDFFVSGGDSLAVAELQAVLADEYAIGFCNADLLANPTTIAFFDNIVRTRTVTW